MYRILGGHVFGMMICWYMVEIGVAPDADWLLERVPEDLILALRLLSARSSTPDDEREEDDAAEITTYDGHDKGDFVDPP